MKEQPLGSLPGIPTALALLAGMIALVLLFIAGVRAGPALIVLGLGFTTLGFCLLGLYMVEPNQAAVLSLFGRYVGTVKDTGLRWNNPFFAKRHVSLRVRNFESGKLKVNELEGSPIEIASVIVWKVVDSAEAVFNVDDYESFVHIQSESALRAMASSYPYEPHNDGDIALRSHAAEVSKHLTEEIQARLEQAGVEVLEARISHLAYSPEIAQAMLQRQQANAVIAARTRIVEGAVSMVEMALDKLAERKVVELDDERRAAMVSNLLVVLCGDRGPQPVLNSGSLY
ncbi:SPFH domain-containing protein [Aquimonas voraii]|uniref:Regulator of protease activity HflC, stomatin/prohibitin superfamily n=1 Tax=Aquimonas voraii TaxID=265719 RepID=A0A1G6WN08_9GAMM|nr:SPFH domain-containing protein [Aquimonas voraii]SDD67184.1 Regulator of protease activity HflC, stomatin/prohibitin superfamily [Aquimonas voraii]